MMKNDSSSCDRSPQKKHPGEGEAANDAAKASNNLSLYDTTMRSELESGSAHVSKKHRTLFIGGLDARLERCM
jgi:hypothetical protein